MICHFIIYNVTLGQRIGVLPREQWDYAMMVDCGYDDAFFPLMPFSIFAKSGIY